MSKWEWQVIMALVRYILSRQVYRFNSDFRQEDLDILREAKQREDNAN